MIHCTFEDCQNTPGFALRCEEHKRCDKCGEKDGLCWYGYVDGLLCKKCRAKQIQKRMENFDGETAYQSLITCPFCGHRINDSWEYNDANGDTLECGDCGNNFEIEVYVEVTYSTRKL